MKKAHAFIFTALAPLLATAGDSAESAKAQLGELFPQMSVEKITAGPAEGIFTVNAGENIFYFMPKEELLIFGEFYTKDGVNLTYQEVSLKDDQAVKNELLDESVAAYITGDEAKQVIAIYDVDCGYCAQSAKWFNEKQKQHAIDLRVLFVSGTVAQAERAASFNCAAPDQRAAALLEVFDRGSKPDEVCAQAMEMASAQTNAARKISSDVTPVFLVAGEAVFGFQPEQLQRLLEI